MGVDIGIKKQTEELKASYVYMEKAFGSRNSFITDEEHPLYKLYKIQADIIYSHPWAKKTEDEIFNSYRGARWFNLSLDAPDYLPHCDNKDILNFSLNQQVLFTEEIEKFVIQFDKIYLKLYPEDKLVKQLSHFFHYLINNKLMLIPS